ncbi:MAG: DUF1015 family protein, partial [Acidimicrobiia bacterium]|nr:DUF1015 family protein [Acidimicrobiia bacterium]
ALTPEERRIHLEQFPLSYLGVTRAPEDFVATAGKTAFDLLADGRKSLEHLISNDVFEPAIEPRYFVYRLSDGEHQQTGLVCGVTVADYDNGQVRIHERIKADRADHLANHLAVVGAQSSPIALASRDPGGTLSRLLAKSTRAEPALDFVTHDGLHQQVWPVTDADMTHQLTEVASAEPLYLIDGHHRAAAAAIHLHRDGDGGGARPGDHWILSTVFPANEMRNQAFHRVVKVDSPADLIALLHSRFDIRPIASLSEVSHRGDGVIAVGHSPTAGNVDWSLLWLPEPTRPLNVVEQLEPSRLAEVILGPLLTIDESNPQGRLRYVPGPATAAALDRLSIAPDEVVFAMRHVTMDELFRASDEGLVMPPKSTYFTPKVRSGLFLHFKDRV